MRSTLTANQKNLLRQLEQFRKDSDVPKLLRQLATYKSYYSEWEYYSESIESKTRECSANIDAAMFEQYKLFMKEMKSKLEMSLRQANADPHKKSLKKNIKEYEKEFPNLINNLARARPILLHGKTLEEQERISREILDIQTQAQDSQNITQLKNYYSSQLTEKINAFTRAFEKETHDLIQKLLDQTPKENQNSIRQSYETELKQIQDTVKDIPTLIVFERAVTELQEKISGEIAIAAKRKAEDAPAPKKGFFSEKPKPPEEQGQELVTMKVTPTISPIKRSDSK